MTQEKVNDQENLTPEERLAKILQEEKQNREKRDSNILTAAKEINEISGNLNARRVYFDMCVKYAADPTNAVDESDRMVMIQIFEVLNVL